jgi:Domain of unknown function (DUF4129)
MAGPFRRTAVIAAAVGLGLVLAGIGLNARPTWTFRADVDQIASRAETTLAVIALLLAILGIAYLLAMRRMSVGEGERTPLWRRLLVGGLALALAFWLVHYLPHRRAPRPHVSGPGSGHQPHGSAPRHHVGSDLYLWLAVLVAVIAVLMVVGIRRARAAAAQPAEPPDDPGPLAAAATALSGGVDPRSRVIDAYDAMERALAAASGRAPQQAPEEWLRDVAVGHPHIADGAAELTGLFERARFSRLEVAEQDAARAAAIVAHLQAAVQSAPDAAAVLP